MKHFEKRITRSAGRSAKLTQVFSEIERGLTAEAQEQREVHALLEVEHNNASQRYREAVNALEANYRETVDTINALKRKASEHGVKSQAAANKIREIFL